MMSTGFEMGMKCHNMHHVTCRTLQGATWGSIGDKVITDTTVNSPIIWQLLENIPGIHYSLLHKNSGV